MATVTAGECRGCETKVQPGFDFCAECCPQAYCKACKDATGGQCREHQEPECTCYEIIGGHQPGCAFYGERMRGRLRAELAE